MPEWVSLQHGTFVCRQCAAVHRGLGVGVSRVRSLQLDLWSAAQLDNVKRGGNGRFFAFCELVGVPINTRAIDLDFLHVAIERAYNSDPIAAYRTLLGGKTGASKELTAHFRASGKGGFSLEDLVAERGTAPRHATTEHVGGAGLHIRDAASRTLEALHYEKLWPHGYDACVAQCWESKRACKIVANSLAEQAKVEARYAAFLDRIIDATDRLEHEEAATTIGAAWRALLKLAASEAGQHHTLAKLMEREGRELHSWRHAQSVTKRELIAQGDACVARLNLACERHDKGKVTYSALAAKCEKAIRTYDAALGDDHAKATKKSKLKHAKVDAIERVLVAQAAYAEAVRELRAQQLTFEGEMKGLLREFEILERARLHHLSRTLRIVAKESKPALIVEANARLDTLQQSLAAISAQVRVVLSCPVQSSRFLVVLSALLYLTFHVARIAAAPHSLVSVLIRLCASTRSLLQIDISTFVEAHGGGHSPRKPSSGGGASGGGVSGGDAGEAAPSTVSKKVPLARMELATFTMLSSTLLHQEFTHSSLGAEGEKAGGATTIPVCTDETPEADRVDNLGGDPAAEAAAAMGVDPTDASRAHGNRIPMKLVTAARGGGAKGAKRSAKARRTAHEAPIDLSKQFLGKVASDSSDTLGHGAPVFLCLVREPSPRIEIRATNAAVVFFSWPVLGVEVTASTAMKLFELKSSPALGAVNFCCAFDDAVSVRRHVAALRTLAAETASASVEDAMQKIKEICAQRVLFVATALYDFEGSAEDGASLSSARCDVRVLCLWAAAAARARSCISSCAPLSPASRHPPSLLSSSLCRAELCVRRLDQRYCDGHWRRGVVRRLGRGQRDPGRPLS
jgi:hypothetical protein